MASTRFLRQMGLPAAVALSLTLSGCPDAAPPASPQAPAPSPSARPSLTPGSVVSAAPPAMEVPPVVDSDMDLEDNAAIADAMESDDMAAYMPADLIHDGGVILFRTLALPGISVSKRAEDALKAEDTLKAAAEPPTEWRRVEGRRGNRALNLRKEIGGDVGISANERRAKVAVRYDVGGRFLVKLAGREVPKQFNQLFSRTFKFKLKNERWQLDQLSPLQHESQGGRSGVDISRVAIYRAGEAEPVQTLMDVDRLISVDDIPVFAPGQQVRLEVAASQKNGVSPYVYAYVVGATDRVRQALRDDGTGGDRVANDGIYAGTFTIPLSPGLRHFGLDVINPAAFQLAGLVRSNGLGISFRVEPAGRQ